MQCVWMKLCLNLESVELSLINKHAGNWRSIWNRETSSIPLLCSAGRRKTKQLRYWWFNWFELTLGEFQMKFTLASTDVINRGWNSACQKFCYILISSRLIIKTHHHHGDRRMTLSFWFNFSCSRRKRKEKSTIKKKNSRLILKICELFLLFHSCLSFFPTHKISYGKKKTKNTKWKFASHREKFSQWKINFYLKTTSSWSSCESARNYKIITKEGLDEADADGMRIHSPTESYDVFCVVIAHKKFSFSIFLRSLTSPQMWKNSNRSIRRRDSRLFREIRILEHSENNSRK